MLEELGSGQELYTQIFRAQIGFWSIAYTEARRAWPWAESVYSDFQGPDRLLVQGVYNRLEELGPGQELYTQIFRSPGRFLVQGVYNRLEKPGPGQDLYTQIFRAQIGSWSGAYTTGSKSRHSGRISILKKSGSGQAPGRKRILVYSKSQA